MRGVSTVQGVTIQGGSMIRTTDVAAMSTACAKRRKKKKRRKQRRLAVVNTNLSTLLGLQEFLLALSTISLQTQL